MGRKINNSDDFCREYGNFLDKNSFAPGSGVQLNEVEEVSESLDFSKASSSFQCDVALNQKADSNSKTNLNSQAYTRTVVYRGDKDEFINQCKKAFSDAPSSLKDSINNSIRKDFSENQFRRIPRAFRSYDVNVVFETHPVYGNRRARVSYGDDQSPDSIRFNLLQLKGFETVVDHEAGHLNDDECIDRFFPGYLDKLRNTKNKEERLEIKIIYLKALFQSFLSEEERVIFDRHILAIDSLDEDEKSALLTNLYEAIRYGEEILNAPDYTKRFAQAVIRGESSFDDILNHIEHKIEGCTKIGKVSYQLALELALYELTGQWNHLNKINNAENAHWNEKLKKLIQKYPGLEERIELMKLAITAAHRFKMGEPPLKRVEPLLHV